MHTRYRSEDRLTFARKPFIVKERYTNQDNYYSKARERIDNYERDTRQLLIKADYGLECPQHS